jgi:hypothetical protein
MIKQIQQILPFTRLRRVIISLPPRENTLIINDRLTPIHNRLLLRLIWECRRGQRNPLSILPPTAQFLPVVLIRIEPLNGPLDPRPRDSTPPKLFR